MNNFDKLHISFGLIKNASPRWAKVLNSLSPESVQKLKDFFPESYARQIGNKELGKGLEGIVYPAFVGRKGESVVKRFTNDISKRWNKEIQTNPYFSNLSFLPAVDRGKAIQAINNPSVLSVYKPTSTGYFAERLHELPSFNTYNTDFIDPYSTFQYLKDNRRFRAASKLLGRYEEKIKGYRKENPIKGFFVNLLKNRVDKYSTVVKEVESKRKALEKFKPQDTQRFQGDIERAKQYALLYNNLIGPGAKPVTTKDVLMENVRPDNLFGNIYKNTRLIKTKGFSQEGMPIYIGDIDFNGGQNIMRRSNGQYVISDPTIAVLNNL
jgi:hypothetical protein